MNPIRIFVVDDHAMIRHGLAAMLRGEGHMQWVGEAADGADAIAKAPAFSPDVVLVDLVMPGMDGVAVIAALKALLPQAKFIALSNLLDPAEVRRALAAGAAGFLLKNATSQDLLKAVTSAARGLRVMAPEVVDALNANPRDAHAGHELTTRERELLALMSTGLSNQDIALRMSIAMPTVKFHVTNILAKLHADNRTEAVLIALRHKLVTLD